MTPCRPVNRVTTAVKLKVPLLGAQRKMLALLDSGCIRCVVTPEVMEKLGLRIQQLRVPTAFYQLDGIVTWGAWSHFIMEPVEMQMGKHWDTLSFIIAPGMERPLLLGLA